MGLQTDPYKTRGLWQIQCALTLKTLKKTEKNLSLTLCPQAKTLCFFTVMNYNEHSVLTELFFLIAYRAET